MAKNMKCTLPEEKRQNFYEVTYDTCLRSMISSLPNGAVTQAAIDECTKLTKRALKQYERQFSVEVTE